MADHIRLAIDNAPSAGPEPTRRDTGGEPPGGNMLEDRVARLEEDMKEVRADTKATRIDVSELKGRVSTLPGYGGIALVVGLIVGLSTLAQIVARFAPMAGP